VISIRVLTTPRNGASKYFVSVLTKLCVSRPEELKREFHDYWAGFGDRPLAGRNLLVSSFSPQVCVPVCFRWIDQTLAANVGQAGHDTE